MSNARPGTVLHASLLQKFKGVVSTPSDVETYDIKRWASNIEAKAAYVVYPIDAADISVAILFSRSEKLPIAITGGGHNVSGASSTEGGLVIDMREMDAVRVDKESKVGYIQGGTTISRAVKELFKYGMASTFGYGGHVGCVGLAIGGGYGFKMGQYGLTCDNIVSATMVLANGEVVFVDDEHHSDLLWGIKGGGSNFGVIAEIGLRLHEARPDVCMMLNTYAPEQLEAVVTELLAWLEVQTPQEGLYLNFGLYPEDGKPRIVINGIADFGAEDGVRLWDRFLKLNPITSSVSQIPYDEYCGGLTGHMPGNKAQGPAHFNKFDHETVKRVYDMWLATTPKAPGSQVVYELYSYDLAAKVPMEATAFSHRSTDKLALVLIEGFADDWTVEAKRAAADIRACVSSSSTKEARESIGYLNHSGAASENDTDATARRAFGSNYPRLQQLKLRYDPDVVFNKWFCVRPADE